MATNPYFNHLRASNEQQLYEDIVRENIQIAGVDVLYIPRDKMLVDRILMEPTYSAFEKTYPIEVYWKNVGGFGGQGDLMSKFGLVINDTLELVVARSQFEHLGIPNRIRPREGDLIFVGDKKDVFTNSLFEITWVEHEPLFWQVGKLYCYEMKCELFRWNGQAAEEITADQELLKQIPEKFGDEKELEKAQNTDIQDLAKELMNFDEKNPFGNL